MYKHTNYTVSPILFLIQRSEAALSLSSRTLEPNLLRSSPELADSSLDELVDRLEPSNVLPAKCESECQPSGTGERRASQCVATKRSPRTHFCSLL